VAAYVAWKDAADVRGLIFAQANAYGMHAGSLNSLLYGQASVTREEMDSVYQLQANLLAGKTDALYDELATWKSLPPEIRNEKTHDFWDAHTSRWRSLEEPGAISYLLKINKPILLLNGLASPGETDNKNIPIDFGKQGKTNLTAQFYPGYDHNFFKTVYDQNGNRKESEFHWDDVFMDVKKWIIEREK
jgi:hypothetical protein